MKRCSKCREIKPETEFYKMGIKRARDRAALPENVRELIGGVAAKMVLEEAK